MRKEGWVSEVVVGVEDLFVAEEGVLFESVVLLGGVDRRGLLMVTRLLNVVLFAC